MATVSSDRIVRMKKAVQADAIKETVRRIWLINPRASSGRGSCITVASDPLRLSHGDSRVIREWVS